MKFYMTWLRPVLAIISALAYGVGLGMILTSGEPPSWMPPMEEWLYLSTGILLFALGAASVWRLTFYSQEPGNDDEV